MPRPYSMAKRREASALTGRRIETALMGLLASKPYGTITIGDIAKAADVSPRTVQRHFSSKDEILAAAFRYRAQAAREELSKRPAAASPEAGIRDLVGAVFAFCDRHSAECWAVYSRASEVPELKEAFGVVVEAWASVIDGLIGRWPGVWAIDEASAKRAMAALLNYPVWRALTDLGGFSTAEAAKIVADMLCQILL